MTRGYFQFPRFGRRWIWAAALTAGASCFAVSQATRASEGGAAEGCNCTQQVDYQAQLEAEIGAGLADAEAEAAGEVEVEEPAELDASLVAEGAVNGAYGNLNAAGVPTYGGAVCRPWQYHRPDLFYNYWQGGNCGAWPVGMYIAPRPVPPWVGHTYYTYQPLLPHEMMYEHHRLYHRYYNLGRGLNRTHIKWYNPPVMSAVEYLHRQFEIPR